MALVRCVLSSPADTRNDGPWTKCISGLKHGVILMCIYVLSLFIVCMNVCLFSLLWHVFFIVASIPRLSQFHCCSDFMISSSLSTICIVGRHPAAGPFNDFFQITWPKASLIQNLTFNFWAIHKLCFPQKS